MVIVLLTGCEQAVEADASWQHAAVGVLDATVSDDGKFAVVSSVNHGVGYWDLTRNELLYQWRHNDNPDDMILATDISPDGTRAITANQRTFIIWDTSNGRNYGYWQAPADITAVAISELGRFVLLGLKNGKVIHIAMETGRRLEFTGHRDESIASVDISANGTWAFSGGNDHRAILWNTRSGEPRYIFEHDTRVTQVRLEAKGRLAFSSGTRGNAIIWDLERGAERTRLRLKSREYVISAAAFSSDATIIATGAPGRDISLWSTRSGVRVLQRQAKIRQQWKPSGAIVYALAFSSNDQFLISEASSGWGQKWSVPAEVKQH
ncbi:MAG: hypothetical protein V2I33_05735 [Kangiellaceae bacterium]|nr:hypothetical protein [Kangiellaceae bacterium]